MPNVAQNTSYVAASVPVSGRAAVWNMRMLTGAAVLILWAASMLAIQAVSPNARAMLAGEGMLIVSTD